ncbi:MAG: hypothetical protein Q9195_000965 [Heterodermia aff. obscurata]
MQSRQASKEMLRSEAAAPTIRQVIHEDSSTSPVQRPPGVHFRDAQTIKRKPLSPEGVVARRAADSELSPPTPGVDDTPYIRFAIDQLTRDEELLGARRPETCSEESNIPNIHPQRNQQRDDSSRQERLSSDTIVRHPRRHSQNIWRWTSVQGVGWALFVIYVCLYAALAIVLLRFWHRQTGLKWDVASLADTFTLVHRSNILSEFEGSELRSTMLENKYPKNHRLGYWRTSNQPNEYFHGIGEPDAPASRYSVEHGKRKDKTHTEKDTQYADNDIESQQPWRQSAVDPLQKGVHSPTIQRQWIPWFLKDSFVVAWIVIVIILAIAFVVVSFVHGAVKRGFLPRLPAPASTGGFSPANFLYSFLPSLIGMILFLLWQPIDLYFRALQPFSNLKQPGGATAENSLLLEYSACPPIKITIKALLAGHWKVAYISFISLLSITLPILGGGVFTAQYFPRDDQVRSAASMPAYDALVFFVIVYALSFLAIWPGRKRHLPHDIRTLGQLISFVYQSSLLHSPTLKDPQTKTDLVTRLLGAEVGEKFVVPRYGFGVYWGMDGREHLGIDRLKRPGVGEMLITTGK